jgi:D-alanyl-D-alanine dipeptidase
MQIHQDEAVASATPFRKAVSFRDVEGSRHHPGRTPLRESNGRTPMGTPHSKFGTNSNNNNSNNNSTTPFKSPSSTKKASVTSNSFRQGLKKGSTPSKAKENSMESNQWSQQQQQQQQQYHFNQKPMPKTPSSASALRRTLRSTIQPQEKQPQEKNTTSTSKQPQKRAVTLNTSSNIASDSGPFRSVATATAMSYSSSYATSSLLGRSRLLGKGGLAPGNTTTSGLGPATRVAPKTPNTLLRTELENDDDEFDESFLLSPPPGALWNALNLNSGARGDKRHTISPTVTTGLIVVSPQAAEQIHTWSSTKKQLSSFHSSPKNRVSPTVPRALMQTPHTVVVATTSTTMTSPTPTTTTPLVQNSSSKSPISELETCEEGTNTATTEENLHSVAKEDEALFVVTTDTGIQSTTDTISTDSAVGTSEAEKMLQRSVKKSTKGGIAMDMTSFFCLEENEPLTKNHNKKKWIESEPLSSSMPPALLSRLSSSKKISQTKETKLPPMVSKVSSKRIQNKETKLPPSSKLKPTSTETKLSVKRSTTIMTANDIKSKSAAPKKVMKLSKETVSKDTVKPWKRQDAKNTLRAENKTAAKNAVVKPWKKQVTTKNPLVAKKKASSVTSQKAPAKDVVKPWKKQAANHTHVPKGPEKNESASTDTSAVHQERSMATESSHSGGMAFDVAFSDVDNTKMQLQTSMNRTRMRTKSSATIKTKESSSRSSSWADKQCEVFVGWLNYTLNPEEMDVNNTGCIVSGLRALIIHRRLAEGRINALNLFKDRSMLQIRTIIAKEIARGRLSIRADRDISVDVHLRKKLTSLLLSYTTPWLRLALEVMCGEIIEPVPISESSPKVRTLCF